MKVSKYLTVLLIIMCLIFFIPFISRSFSNTYGSSELTKALEAKGYTVSIADIGEHFLPAAVKLMHLEDENVYVYMYPTKIAAEKEARRITPDGYGYNGELDGQQYYRCVEWSCEPNYFKKGEIIVLYVGENKQIIRDLTDIMGEKFAGMY